MLERSQFELKNEICTNNSYENNAIKGLIHGIEHLVANFKKVNHLPNNPVVDKAGARRQLSASRRLLVKYKFQRCEQR
jgi:hypothetical protein